MSNRSINRFDGIAPFYDNLAKMVFGRHITSSQEAFLNLIPENAIVLILGGGTGKIIPKILEQQPHCEIWYIEASQKMITYAKKRSSGHNVHFIHGTQEQIPAGLFFDVVITNFFLDLFPDSAVQEIASAIKLQMKSNTLWLVTDFVNQGKLWQHYLLVIMYTFFRLTSGTEVKTLPSWEEIMKDTGYVNIKNKAFYNGFIKSIAYCLT